MKAKHQRLTLALAALAAILGSGLLAMSALKEKASYFYAPSDIDRAQLPAGRAIRLGGMVRKGSLHHEADGVTMTFVVVDEGSAVPVRFRGIAPDLFREGAGVVAEGSFAACPGATAQPTRCGFVATNILAKHDERYMPPKPDRGLHKTTTLRP
jgi:cytochrome c-type biogenesis protein CcmE